MIKSIKWLIIIGIIAPIFCVSTSYAENPAANTYRQIFQDDSFYMKYAFKPCDDKGKFLKVPFLGDYESVRTIYSSPEKRVGLDDGVARLVGNVKKYCKPYIYMNGNYYFITGLATSESLADSLPLFNMSGKKYRSLQGTMLSETDFPLYDFSNVDVRNYGTKDKAERRLMGILSAYETLPLPEELNVFFDDPLFHSKYTVEEPIFEKSFTKTIKNKTYDCDRYITAYISENGSLIDQIAYDIMYENGRLVMSQRLSLQNGEILKSQSSYMDISDEVPEDVFENTLPIQIFALGGDSIEAVLNNKTETLVEVIEVRIHEEKK